MQELNLCYVGEGAFLENLRHFRYEIQLAHVVIM